MQLIALLCWLTFVTTLVSGENSNPSAEASNTLLNFRLPNNTYPEHYDITITTNVDKGEKSFQGEVIIDIAVAEDTENIVLHSCELDISKVSLISESSKIEELSSEYESDRDFLTLRRKNNNQFSADTKWKVAITYTGRLRDDKMGFGFYNYTDEKGQKHYLAATFLDKTNARYAFPCYNEPAKLANFTITVNHSPSYTAISNMPVNPNLSSSNKTVFLTTSRIPTHVVAFVVSELEYSEVTWNGIRQRVYSRPSMKSEHKYPLSYGLLLLDYMSKYSDVEFMLPKLDYVVIPDYATTGMESWGLIIYSEERFKYNKVNSTDKELIDIRFYLAQGIAGQWLNDYVTSQWWSDDWLNGGLFSLFSFKALDRVFPELNIWPLSYNNVYQFALAEDSKNYAKPLSFHVQGPHELGYIHKQKAICVLSMWNSALTDKVFQKAIRTFLKNNPYSAVGEQELFTAIQSAIEEESLDLPAKIEEMMSTWTHQVGYPLLTITRNYEDGTFNIKQEAFHSNETVKDVQTWYVPINFAVATMPDFHDTKATHYLLNVKETEVDAGIDERDWLVVNKQSTGFYRVKYDEKNYNLITKSLTDRPSSIHYHNRAQLLDDAFHLSTSNRLDYSIFLKMLTYLKLEDQYVVWNKVGKIFREHFNYLQEYEDYKYFIAELVRPIYKKLGVEEMDGESNNDKMTRPIIIEIACAVGVTECLVETNSKLKALVEENKPIEPSLEWVIKQNGLIISGDKEFDFFYQKLMDSKELSIFEIVSYLAFSRNKIHLRKVLNSSIDKTIQMKNQTRIRVVYAVCCFWEHYISACTEFLNENWNAYGSLESNSDHLNYVITEMAEHVRNENEKERLLDLVAKVNKSEYVEPSLEMVVNKKIAERFEHLEKHDKLIMSWISKYVREQRLKSIK